MGLWDRLKATFGEAAGELGGDLLDGDDDEHRGRRGTSRADRAAADDDGDDEPETGRAGRRRDSDDSDID